MGFGEAIWVAVNEGARKVVLALGGSASTDGGAGMLAALGFEFSDAGGNVLWPNGRNLIEIHSVQWENAIDMSSVELVMASDVTNPLTGPTGAARVFGAQMGAHDDQIEYLDRGLRAFVAALSRSGCITTSELAGTPGAGAAGGCGFAGILLVVLC